MTCHLFFCSQGSTSGELLWRYPWKILARARLREAESSVGVIIILQSPTHFVSLLLLSILSSSEIIWTCWIDTRQCTLWRGFWGWLKSLWSSTSIGYFNLPYLYSFFGVSIFQHFGTNPLSFAFFRLSQVSCWAFFHHYHRQTITPTFPFDQSLDTWCCVPCDRPQIMAVNLTLPPSSGFPLALTETIKQNAMRTSFATFRFLSNPKNSGGK